MKDYSLRDAKRYILELVSRINAEYPEYKTKVIVKPNTGRTYHRFNKLNYVHTLTFGGHYLNYFLKNGYSEYKKIAWVWGSELKTPGLHAIWCVVLHEYAHVLQSERYERKRGIVHNNEFVRCLRELQEKFPFEEVEEKEEKVESLVGSKVIADARLELRKMFANK